MPKIFRVAWRMGEDSLIIDQTALERSTKDLLLGYSGPNAPEVPVKNIQNCNKSTCSIEQFNEAGLGLGKATNEVFTQLDI